MQTETKKKYVAIAHINEPELTYEDVEVPNIVPLYVNFDTNERAGSAVLKVKGERIYAVMEMNVDYPEFSRTPAIVLRDEGAEKVINKGICYLRGGFVACASIVKNEIWQEVYGSDSEMVHELD